MMIKPYTKSNYETIVMTNPVNLLNYEIFIAKPFDDPPREGYGIIFILDGNGIFETAAEITRLMTRKPKGYDPAIVVGIGYPGGEAFDKERRMYDLTTQADPVNLPQRPNGESWSKVGGADELLSFLENSMLPAIEQQYNVNQRKRALFGHSLGGLFVLHAMYTKPSLLSHYIASSSSIWWNQYAVLQEYEAFKREQMAHDTEHIIRSLLIVGGNELEYMVKDSLDLYASMKELHIPHFEVHMAMLEGEEHISVISGAISRAVKFMLSD